MVPEQNKKHEQKKKFLSQEHALPKELSKTAHQCTEESQGYIHTLLRSFQHFMLVLQPNSLDEVQRASGFIDRKWEFKTQFCNLLTEC